jgi:signal transduction histidine kinase/CheY-like chemotaxis protein
MCEHRMVHKDQSIRWIFARGTAVRDSQGNTVRMFGTDTDITDRKKMEEELQRFEKLDAVGVLAGGIAHDYNNILTAILGNISVVKLDLPRNSKSHALLEEAERASLRAKALTLQLLTFSRGGDPQKKQTSITAAIEDAASDALKGATASCVFSIPENLWTVEVDLGQIKQVIHNIVTNAEQAMPEGGIIEINAENVNLGRESGLPLQTGRHIKISIADRGIGVPSDQIGKIFYPYFSTNHQGSGLGLATAYWIVQRHLGHIAVESRFGVGTTFHVYLPAGEETLSVIPEPTAEPISGKGRVLIMDDQAIVRSAAMEMLKRVGYDVVPADDGAAAIALYQEAQASGAPFDALILDLTVPGGLGAEETIRELLRVDPNVRAIVSSGYVNDPIISDFRDHGFIDRIVKPYDLHELSETLARVLQANETAARFPTLVESED